MASSSGFQLTAGRIPGEQIALNTETTDSSNWTTTETQTDAVTAPLVIGRTYRIRYFGGVVSTVANDVALIRIRENNTSGTALAERNFSIPSTSSGGYACALEARYTALATANKTFVATGVRNGGTGTHHADGTTVRTRLLYVEYISG